MLRWYSATCLHHHNKFVLDRKIINRENDFNEFGRKKVMLVTSVLEVTQPLMVLHHSSSPNPHFITLRFHLKSVNLHTLVFSFKTAVFAIKFYLVNLHSKMIIEYDLELYNFHSSSMWFSFNQNFTIMHQGKLVCWTRKKSCYCSCAVKFQFYNI